MTLYDIFLIFSEPQFSEVEVIPANLSLTGEQGSGVPKMVQSHSQP